MNRILDLVSRAVIINPIYEEINFGNVPNFQSQEIKRLTGIDVQGAMKILSTHGVLHILSSHGNDKKERERGQVGIISQHFELIPDILNKPDSISRGNISKKGEEAILFTKIFGRQAVNLVMNVKRSASRKVITVGTMYVKQRPAN